MASLGALGFLGGASKTALDSIQMRQKEEAELRKAKMLEELRAATAKDLANFEDLLSGKKIDTKLSGFEGDEFIGRNAKGEEVSRRAATAAEKEAQEFERRNNSLALDKAGLDIENTRSTIASRARDDARQDRYTNASIANMGRKSGGALDGSGGGVGGGPVDEYTIANEFLDLHKGLVATAKKAEVGEDMLQEAAATAAREAATNPRYKSAAERQAAANKLFKDRVYLLINRQAK